MADEAQINTLQVEFCTLDRAPIRVEATSVSLPGSLGMLTILPGHAPLLSTLEIGVVKVLYTNGEQHYFSNNGGVVKVLNNQVLLLTETVEMDDEIDIKRARDAHARAEKRLQGKGTGTDINRAETSRKRAASRIRTHTLATENRKER